MKKIFSLLTAGFLALGLMGCSGLHDAEGVDLTGGAIPGAMNDWTNTTSFTTADANLGLYTYDFQAKSDNVEWKIITTAGDWNSGAYGEATVLADGNFVELEYDDKTGAGENAKTIGLIPGNTYRITVKVDVMVVSAKIELIKSIPTSNLIVKKSGKIETFEMTPVTDGYQYLLKAEESGSIEFAINIGSMIYYSAETSLTLGEEEEVSPTYRDPDTYTTFSYEKGEYIIMVDISAGYDSVKLSARYAMILKSAFWAIQGPMGMKEITESEDGIYRVEFTAEQGGWGATPPDMCFTIYAQKSKDSLMDGEKWWSGTAYRYGGFDVKIGEQTTCQSNGDNITLKDVVDGATYEATLVSDAENVYLTVSLKQ